MKKKIAILGSTGSIGTQALEVISNHPDKFELELISAHNNSELLISQALKYKPSTVIITNENKFKTVNEALSKELIKVFAGAETLNQAVQLGSVDMVLTAIVGAAGLMPTIKAIEAGKDIALANKETMVVAGELVTDLARRKKVNIIPVDSEHSAIFQCLVGETNNAIEKIYLTASGGPFRGKDLDYLKKVTKKQALKHPNWSMGAKITIDSASLMNKGLEVIEAKWLFDLYIDQIDVIVHPQSIVHSLVQFEDGSIKAQMGLPDMKLPIQYALAYPERVSNTFPRFCFTDYPSLNFEKANTKIFRNLALAFEAIKMGGNIPCALNAANEIAVDAFLKDQISFLGMTTIIEETMSKIKFIAKPGIEQLLQADAEARQIAGLFIK